MAEIMDGNETGIKQSIIVIGDSNMVTRSIRRCDSLIDASDGVERKGLVSLKSCLGRQMARN